VVQNIRNGGAGGVRILTVDVERTGTAHVLQEIVEDGMLRGGEASVINHIQVLGSHHHRPAVIEEDGRFLSCRPGLLLFLKGLAVTIRLVLPSDDCNTAQTQQETQPIFHVSAPSGSWETRWRSEVLKRISKVGQERVWPERTKKAAAQACENP